MLVSEVHIYQNFGNFFVFIFSKFSVVIELICYSKCLYFHLNSEKLKLKEEVMARRQQKLLVRHTRQKYLEEAASREAELIQQLDRFSILSFLSNFLSFVIFVCVCESKCSIKRYTALHF